MAEVTGGNQTPRGWRFGPFELDLATAELTRGGERVRLQDKPFELLVALIEARGEMVTREALHERLWPGVIVDFETSLNAAVRRLRDALKDSAEAPAYVETVPRRGYRFLADVEPLAPRVPRGASAPSSSGAGVGAPAEDVNAATPVERRKRFLAGVALGMSLVAVFALLLAVVAKNDPTGGERLTLLVLPFETLSASDGDNYLGDGLTDEMISRFGRLDPIRLRVIARTSARRFADGGHDLKDARALLGAEFALEGSILREAGRVRVNATLVKIHDRGVLWSGTFDRDVADVLALQSDIASRVADALALKLLPPARVALADTVPVDPVAFDATLRARHFWNQQTPDGFRRAGEAYREALAADSTYAPAWAGLADTYALVGIYDFLPPRDVFPLARRAAMRALAIDSTRSEAWASLGIIQTAFDWDWAAAERSLRRAIELNPSNAIAHEWHAILLGVTGHADQSFEESKRALDIDPMSLIVNADHGWLLFFARRYDDAIAQLLNTIVLDPHFYVAHDNLAWVYFVKGDQEGWVHHALRALELTGEPAETIARIRERYERVGGHEWRRESIEGMTRESEKQYVSPYDIALQYAALGEAEEAMGWLERSFERREVDMIALNADPRLDVVRSLPAFGALVRRVGLPDVPAAPATARR